MTGHPDFGLITVRYVPDKKCVETQVAQASTSTPTATRAFSSEAVRTNKICDDIGDALRPRSLTIIADWKARGGFTSIVTAWNGSRRRNADRRVPCPLQLACGQLGPVPPMDSHLIEFLSLLVRWLHVIASIAWIGSSFLFHLAGQQP